MANDTTKNPWILDTPAIIDSTGIYRVKGIRVVSAGAAAGDVVTIADGSSRVFWTTVAPGANWVEADRQQVLNSNPVGFILQQISKGKVYIELG